LARRARWKPAMRVSISVAGVETVALVVMGV